MQFWNATLDYSESLSLYIAGGVPIVDITNPSAPTTTPFNWITDGGYADGALLDGDPADAPTKPFIHMSILDASGRPQTIWQGGDSVVADKVPFRIASVAPTIPYIVFNAPRTPGATHHVIIVFSKPGSADTEITKFDVRIT